MFECIWPDYDAIYDYDYDINYDSCKYTSITYTHFLSKTR